MQQQPLQDEHRLLPRLTQRQCRHGKLLLLMKLTQWRGLHHEHQVLLRMTRMLTLTMLMTLQQR